jgi:hypothetical protein
LVFTKRLVDSPSLSRRKKVSNDHATTLRAMKFSMIVEITSLTFRFTFNQPAIPDHSAPVAMATTKQNAMCNGAGRFTAPPMTAVDNRATRI